MATIHSKVAADGTGRSSNQQAYECYTIGTSMFIPVLVEPLQLPATTQLHATSGDMANRSQQEQRRACISSPSQPAQRTVQITP